MRRLPQIQRLDEDAIALVGPPERLPPKVGEHALGCAALFELDQHIDVANWPQARHVVSGERQRRALRIIVRTPMALRRSSAGRAASMTWTFDAHIPCRASRNRALVASSTGTCCKFQPMSGSHRCAIGSSCASAPDRSQRRHATSARSGGSSAAVINASRPSSGSPRTSMNDRDFLTALNTLSV